MENTRCALDNQPSLSNNATTNATRNVPCGVKVEIFTSSCKDFLDAILSPQFELGALLIGPIYVDFEAGVLINLI